MTMNDAMRKMSLLSFVMAAIAGGRPSESPNYPSGDSAADIVSAGQLVLVGVV